MIDAHHKRKSHNQTHECLGCPFGCNQNKQGQVRPKIFGTISSQRQIPIIDIDY